MLHTFKVACLLKQATLSTHNSESIDFERLNIFLKSNQMIPEHLKFLKETKINWRIFSCAVFTFCLAQGEED